MDYILKDWKKALQDLSDSVEKSVEEIRKCKDAVQRMQAERMNDSHSGKYIRDDYRIVLSAPEIIIGNLSKDGYLLSGQDVVTVRGHSVSLEGTGPAASVVSRAPSIRSVAVDPGADGRESVVGGLSEVVCQAKGISLCSSYAEGAFSSSPAAGQGLHLHSDSNLTVEAAASADVRKKSIESRLSALKDSKSAMKTSAGKLKTSFEDAVKRLEDVLEKGDSQSYEISDIRSNIMDMDDLRVQFDQAVVVAAQAFKSYSEQLAALAETCRQINCLEKEKGKIPASKDFQDKTTGAAVRISGEVISLSNIDGDGNIRVNPEAGVSILTNAFSLDATAHDGSLLEKGRVSMNARTFDFSTANVKYDDKKKRDSAKIPAEGDINVISKNVTVMAVDTEFKDKKLTEKALSKDGRLSVRVENLDVSATDTEGKATGKIALNAKNIAVKAMDVKKDDRKDDKLAAGSSLTLTAEKVFAGSRDKNNKTKQMQISADKTAIFGDTTAEVQQGEAKAVVQLDGGNLSVSGSKTAIFGDTTVNGKTDFKADINAPKAAIGNVEAKSSFKSPNISDGIAVPGAPSSATLSAKLKFEEKKEDSK